MCEEDLEGALEFLQGGFGDIHDYWHDDAWAAYLACEEALTTLRAGPPTEEE
jgi:hypothetical protein